MSIATTLSSLIDASKLQPTPQYEQVVLTFLSTAADLDWNTSEIASVGHVWAQAPHDTQELSPNIISLSVVILDSNPLPLIVKTNDPRIICFNNEW